MGQRASWLVALPLAGLALAGCGGSHGSAAPPATLALAVQAAGHASAQPVKVGVIYTDLPGAEGSDVAGAAEGAVVAQLRLASGGGVKVDLVPASDDGSATGALAAERSLASQGVAGIVYASTGRHIDGAVAAASQAGVPVLLPYDDGSDLSASGQADVWLTGPTVAEEVSAVNARLAGTTGPIYVLSNSSLPASLSGLVPGATRKVAGAGGSVKLPAKVGAVVVWGDAASSAQIVATLQRDNLDGAPLVLSPAALEPGFGDALSKAAESGSATTDQGFLDVGETTTDFTGTTGETGFLLGLRAATADPSAKSLGGRAFSTEGADADTRAYDAVVALTVAASKARSDAPTDVSASLRALKVDASNGLAGGTLDFSKQDALASGDVSILESTSQATGLRPVEPTLSWYAITEKS